MVNHDLFSSSQEKWQPSLETAISKPHAPILIAYFRKSWKSSAQPVLARGIDNCNYVFKGRQAGRQIVNDQIIARLGATLHAPVPATYIVELDEDLLECYPDFDFLTPGTAHATLYVPDCIDNRELEAHYTQRTENRLRLALLCVLYGWVQANDHQFIFEKQQPNLVYSVDHGHFFPHGPNWTIQNLIQASPARLDERLCKACDFNNKSEEIRKALSNLESVTETQIISAVASPPTEWGLTMEERSFMVEYLVQRKQQLINLL